MDTNMKPPVTDVKTKVEVVKVAEHFTFEGNLNGVVVNKVDSNLGDGEMGTDSQERIAEVEGSVMIQNNILTATISFTVSEANWGYKNPKSDKLRMIGTIKKDLNAIFDLSPKTTSDVKKTTTITKSWKLRTDTSYAHYVGRFPKGKQHGYKYLNDKISDKRFLKEWLPVNNLRVMIDGEGNELYKQGNMRIDGDILIFFELTTETKYTYKSEESYDKAYGNLLQGTNPVLSLPDNVKTVLCRSYDITQTYANVENVMFPVLDIDKVNNNKFITVLEGGTDGFTIKAESNKEISSKYEQALNVSISAHGFGATFSNETKRGITKETSFNEGRKYVSINKIKSNKVYKIDITPSTSGFASLLSDRFILDLNTMTPGDIIKNYGTHVIMGVVIGARLCYYMSYVKSIEKWSSALTFSNKMTIGYNEGGVGEGSALKDSDKEEKKEKGENTEDTSSVDIINKVLNNNVSTDTLKALNELLKLTKSNGKSSTNNLVDKQNAGILGGQISLGLDINSTKSSKFENETMYHDCYIIGGDETLHDSILSDLTNINTWMKSLNDSNSNKWADFVKGRLYPIYEFVPMGCKVTSSALKAAWEDYLNGIKVWEECGKTVLSKDFSIMGGDDNVEELRTDDEIDSQDGKKTGWRLYMEPVNIEGGDVAVAVELIVGENGLDSSSSKLMLHDTILIPRQHFNYVAIDSSKLSQNAYVCEGAIYKKCHDFIDITESLRDCPFVETSHNSFKIQIDGSGKDKKNLKVEGVFKVPVIGYRM